MSGASLRRSLAKGKVLSPSDSAEWPRTSNKAHEKIDFTETHWTLLLIAGGSDHVIPASFNRKDFDAYQHVGSQKDFQLSGERTHYICARSGREEVASYVADWMATVVAKQ